MNSPLEDLWAVKANLFLLPSVASRARLEHPTIVGNRKLEPETAKLVREIMSSGRNAMSLTRERTVLEALSELWPGIVAAAARRATRGGRHPSA